MPIHLFVVVIATVVVVFVVIDKVVDEIALDTWISKVFSYLFQLFKVTELRVKEEEGYQSVSQKKRIKISEEEKKLITKPSLNERILFSEKKEKGLCFFCISQINKTLVSKRIKFNLLNVAYARVLGEENKKYTNTRIEKPLKPTKKKSINKT